MKNNSVYGVIEEIKKGKNFLITSHVNPEGDSIGSELALAYLLDKLKKNFFIYNANSLPNTYRFLPLRHFLERKKRENFDTAIVLDCSDLGRTGKVEKFIAPDKTIINIDHHPDNIYFGKVNWVKPKASAVGELIYELFKKLNVPLNREVALCIYTAIVTDTACFRNENTTADTHRIVSHLLKYNFKPSLVFEHIYEMFSLARMKLLGIALGNLKIDKTKRIAWMVVSQEILRKAKAKLEDTEGFIEMIRSIEGIRLAVLFQEIEKNKVKVGFRSRGGLDAGRLARILGGGGHFAASGCILEGKLKEIEKLVLSRIKREI